MNTFWVRRRLVGAVVLVSALAAILAAVHARTAAAVAPGTVVQTAHADFDGDGLPLESIVLRQGATSASYFMDVHADRNVTLTASLSGGDGSPKLLKVGNVDGRAGDELFVRPGCCGLPDIDLWVFTDRHGALYRTGPIFQYLTPSIGVDYGVACSSHKGQHFVTQRTLLMASGPDDSIWYRTDDTYVWERGQLRLLSHGKKHKVKYTGGRLPASVTGVHCGHNPAR